jgi:hypothetical protein
MSRTICAYNIIIGANIEVRNLTNLSLYTHCCNVYPQTTTCFPKNSLPSVLWMTPLDPTVTFNCSQRIFKSLWRIRWWEEKNFSLRVAPLLSNYPATLWLLALLAVPLVVNCLQATRLLVFIPKWPLQWSHNPTARYILPPLRYFIAQSKINPLGWFCY